MTAPMFDMNGAQVSIGDRVEIGAHHDLWMMGAKYGEVRSTEAPTSWSSRWTTLA